MADLPEAGQLVEVRNQQWIVAEPPVSGSLPDDPLFATVPRQHLVRLTSVEEDGLGDSLEVIWEIEPGATVRENLTLPEPDGFDPPARLDVFLDAVRWGVVDSADVRSLQSPFRAGITIEDYQLDPVVRALQMSRVNLLIADDVGLGKTIETGLVAQELILRHRVSTILVVCPSPLQIQWRDQMRDKFGLEFRIVDSDLLRELRRRRGIDVNPWTHLPRLITSIDFLKREHPLRAFRETLPSRGESVYPRRYDLLILDEAHNVAPSGTGSYALDSQRTQAIRTLAPHFEHKLFLTATPSNGYRESFTALLELLDDRRFARDLDPDRKQLEAVMVRRLKSELKNWDGAPRFKPRHVLAIEVPYTNTEREAHGKLKRYSELRQARAGDATAGLATDFVLKLLKKRMFSCPAAFAGTLGEHEKTLRGIEKVEKRVKPKVAVLRKELERAEEDRADDDSYEDVSKEAVSTATTMFDKLADEEKRLLRELKDWARQASARPDVKARRLLDWLAETVRPKGKWNDERVIVFTEYRDTQKWLLDLMSREGLVRDDRTMVIYGGMDEDERERIKAAFQARPSQSSVRILLATDAASEGIDLQNWCHRVIHYEIPWNPNRLEQRNGRVDRHGQRHEPLIYHFVGAGWDATRDPGATEAGDLEGDLEFLMRAAQKVEQIREDLLGKVGPVIASQVEDAMLGRRKRLDTARAEADAEPVRAMLKFERDLRKRISELHEKLAESRKELNVSPATVRAVVDTGLELVGQPALQPATLAGVWPDPEKKRAQSPVFRLSSLRDSWERCLEGLSHPHTGEIRPITFDSDVAAGRDDVVLVHLEHPLVRMCQRLLRAEIWAVGDSKRLHRVTARIVPDSVTDVPVVVAHARLLVLGGTDKRLHEQILEAGGHLRDGRFVRIRAVTGVHELLTAATSIEPSDPAKDRLRKIWPKVAPAVLEALEARMKDRTKHLETFLAEKAEKEISDIRAVMEELQRSIEAEIADRPERWTLYNQEEKAQWQLNREALRARLAGIPDDLERESEVVRSRYTNPDPRLFPVCVTFLVPERLART